MASHPTSSSNPIPTFQDTDGASPKELLSFLQDYTRKLENDPVQELLHDKRGKALSLLDNLDRDFLLPFPPPNEYSWNNLHEKIKLSEIIFELLYQMARRCGEVLCLQENIGRSIFSKLINLATSLDAWVDVPYLPEKNGYATPDVLLSNCIRTTSRMLHAFKEGVAIDHGGPPGWKILRAIGEECSAVCKELLSNPMSAIFYIHLFSTPKIHPGNPPPPPASKKARDSEAVQDRTKRTFVHVHDPSQIPMLLTLLLEIQLTALDTPALGDCFVFSLVNRTLSLVRQVHEYLTSPACVTTDVRRARAITRLVITVSTRVRSLSSVNTSADPMRLHLLVRRLTDGPLDAWAKCDKLLFEAFAAPFARPILQADALSILVLLREEQWEDSGSDLRAIAAAYLRNALPGLDAKFLDELTGFLRLNGSDISYINLLTAVEEHTAGTRAVDPQPSVANIVDETSKKWRRVVRNAVQKVVEPDNLMWTEDEYIDDAKFVARALSDIESRFERPIYNPSADGRAKLAKSFAALPCVLARHYDSPCPLVRTSSSLNPLKTCLLLVTCILDGTDNEVKPSVRKATFTALTRSIRHQTVKYQGAGLEHIEQLAAREMKNLDRNVRLSAGRCLVELVRFHLWHDGADSAHLGPIFSTLQTLLTSKDDFYKETALITATGIAKIPEPETLRRSIYCILSAVGHPSPLIKNTAFEQIQEIAKHHKKSVYHLLSPDMDLLAPYLVGRLKSHPQALVDICALMSTPASSFISVTLPHTLPHLFANRERENLDIISVEIGLRLHEMFLEYASRILAEVFMQTKPGKTTKSLAFIVEILAQASSTSRNDLDAQHVVRGQIVEVIGDIVLKLGDPDEDVIESAKKALMKVQQVAENRQSQYDTVDEAVRALLQQHMLGVVSQINDYLQEVHGKQTVESKRRIIKSLGVFIDLVGPAIQGVSPQIMATMQTSITIEELSETTIDAWNIFLRALKSEDLSPHIGPTTSTFVIAWPTFSPRAEDLASQSFHFLLDKESTAVEFMEDTADFSFIPKLKKLWGRVKQFREKWTPHHRLRKLLEKVGNDNTAVVSCGLQEMKSLLLEDDERFIRNLSSGDVFDPLVGQVMTTLFAAASRDLEGSDNVNQLALECIGIVGAIDPDRFRFGGSEGTMIVKYNFRDESESMSFAIHLIKDVLVGAFRSTCDIAYQNFLAYAIQELLRFCRFSSSLVTPGSSGSLPIKVRNRWKELPRAVKETVAPLLAGRFAFRPPPQVPIQHPIYPRLNTYREWIQAWTACLLYRTSGRDAQTIFSAFHPVVRNKDVGVAHHLLPHLVLNVLLSDNEQYIQDIRTEVMAVLQDQVNVSSTSNIDKKGLSAQAIFILMDHLNRWVRTVRQDAATRQQRKKSTSEPDPGTEEYQLLRVDSVLTSIDHSLMAKAALRCKAYARALMCFEQQLVSLRHTEVAMDTKIATYEVMHEIYAQLDEPDGMEGISALIITPSLEHQIREHESTGRWTSAQSCWEVRLQHSPNDLESHVGLLRCLKSLGHYDTMRTHVDGLLIRNHIWEPQLLDYQIESNCIVGNWDAVRNGLDKAQHQTSPALVARALLAMQSVESDQVQSSLSLARKVLGAPISAAGAREYRRSYQAVLDLHMLHEVQVIYQEARNLGDPALLDARLDSLQRRLSARLDSTLPSFRSREPLLSMRRAALALQTTQNPAVQDVLGRSWLLSAKLARKAGYWQTAYSAILQARQNNAPFLFIESAKLSKATGEPLKALLEVENSLGGLNVLAEIKHDEIKVNEAKIMSAKVTTLRARWLGELGRHDPQYIINEFQKAANALPSRESGWFHWGQFHDECANALKTLKKDENRALRRVRMNMSTIRSFVEACSCGSKHVYQTLSRLITLWLNVLGDDDPQHVYPLDEWSSIHRIIQKGVKTIPLYKWYIALPQLISRVGHPHDKTYALLHQIIRAVTLQYPNQSLWQLISVVKSNQPSRRSRGLDILQKLKGHKNTGDVGHLINASLALTDGLLGLCNNPLHGHDKKSNLSMVKFFPKLYGMLPLPVIIPLQESLRAVLPSIPSAEASHQPFPLNAPTFHEFDDEVEIMRSLARPRKLTITGSDGKTYTFLGKPKDDLRKDARLMDFNAIINQQLKSNSESRRRQLYIRTYGVVTLNEECGFIQWVPNTIPYRNIIAKHYLPRGLPIFDAQVHAVFDKLGALNETDAVQMFRKEVLGRYQPVMHEWFVETFPEPAAWLSSRIAYTRTAAVMSMVGFILGLGDRHCENILMDMRSGDVVHVDFNCLFDKGKTLQTPERVPFRCTQNVVDGFGVTGVEGPFRIACEITMQALRSNRDCLSTVLDAFIHDPLVEWQELKRDKERAERRGNQVKESTDLLALAQTALQPIRAKLQGYYSLGHEIDVPKEIPISSMVEVLITEATDLKNLSKMYIGWTPYF